MLAKFTSSAKDFRKLDEEEKRNQSKKKKDVQQKHTDLSIEWIRGTHPTIVPGALRQTLKANSTEEQGNIMSSSIEKTASVFKSLISLNLLFRLSSLLISNFSSICLPSLAFECTTWFKNLTRLSDGGSGSLHTICIESSPRHDV